MKGEPEKEVIRQRIRGYLGCGLNQSLRSRMMLESPAAVLFNYTSLLVSALNHEVSGDGECRYFADIAFSRDGKVKWYQTTLPDIDKDLFPPLKGLVSFHERLHGAREEVYRCWFEREKSGIGLLFGIGGGRAGGRRAEMITALVCDELSRCWESFAEHQDFHACLVPVTGYTEGSRVWPDKLIAESPFHLAAREAFDRLRNILDYLKYRLAPLTEMGSGREGHVYFLRKNRYHDRTEKDGRHVFVRASRFIWEPDAETGGDKTKCDYLLSYFLPVSHVEELMARCKDPGKVIAELGSLAARLRMEKAPGIGAFIEGIANQKPASVLQKIVEGIEIPHGDTGSIKQGEVVRSVSDSCFVTGVPELVWNVDEDPRYSRYFRSTAAPLLDLLEHWMWPEGKGANTFLFLPFTAGSNPFIGAYLNFHLGNPLHDDGAMEDLKAIADACVQANRGYFQYIVGSYPDLVVGRLMATLLDIISKRESPDHEIHFDSHVEEQVEALNETCQALASIYGMPPVKFKRRDEDNWLTIWDCYCSFREGVHHRGSQHIWSEEDRNKYFLDKIAFSIDDQDQHTEVLRAAIKKGLQRRIGAYVTHELWTQLRALELSGEAGKIGQELLIKHEIGDLVNHMYRLTRDLEQRRGSGQLLQWCLKVLHGRVKQIGASSRMRESSDIAADLRCIQALYHPESASINSWSTDIRIFIVPDDGEKWIVPLSSSEFYAIWANLWKNARDALTVYSWPDDVELDRDMRLYDRIMAAVRQHGKYQERFDQAEDSPDPRILMILARDDEEGIVRCEILDNAPELAGGPINYSPDLPAGNHGSKEIKLIIERLDEQGITCEHISPAELTPEVADYLRERLSTISGAPLDWLNEPRNWTRSGATFPLEKPAG